MITTLDDFVREFTKIKEAGWIKTLRSGPTGVGKTLEDLLGIPENNLDQPDFGDYELKSSRINSQSMLTLFTRAPQPRRANTYLRKTFGYSSDAYDNDEKVLHSTLNAVRFVAISNTGHKLKIDCTNGKISIASENGIENVYWTEDKLRAAFEKKYKNKMVYARAESRGTNALEEFKYVEAYEASKFDFNTFIDLLKQGKIYVDLRIGQYPDGRTHDHGTGFRIRESDEHLLFINRKRIV